MRHDPQRRFSNCITLAIGRYAVVAALLACSTIGNAIADGSGPRSNNEEPALTLKKDGPDTQLSDCFARQRTCASITKERGDQLDHQPKDASVSTAQSDKQFMDDCVRRGRVCMSKAATP